MSRDELLALISRVVVRMGDVDRALRDVKGPPGDALDFHLGLLHQRLEAIARCESMTVDHLMREAQRLRPDKATRE